MVKLLDGRTVADAIYSDLKKQISKSNKRLGLGAVLVGDNIASLKYIAIKSRKCRELGIRFDRIHLSSDATQEEIINAVHKLNKDRRITGIIVQLPLPKSVNNIEIFSEISEEKDIEGLNPVNYGKLVMGENIKTVTPAAITAILDYYNVNISGKDVVIINRSNLIGKPLVPLLLKRDATVTICHSESDLIKHTKEADMIVSAVGKPKFITSDMIKKGAILFDLGFSTVDGKIIGDLDFDDLKDKCSYITPNPGGVGPVTVALLLKNTVENGY